MQLNKRGGERLGIKEVIEIILAAAAILVLVELSISIISPYFDKDQKIAESYFDSLKNAIQEADNLVGGSGTNFSIWQNPDNKFYLVCLNNSRRYIIDGKEAFLEDRGENLLCICYVSENILECDIEQCIDLQYSAYFCDTSCKSSWDLGKVFTVNIKNEGSKYVFREV